MFITARCCTILLTFLLTACSSVQTTEQAYVRPSPPTEKAIGAAVAELAKEAKLVTPSWGGEWQAALPRAFRKKNDAHGLDQDQEIQEQRAVLHVIEVISELLLRILD